MERTEIIDLINKQICYSDMSKCQKILEKNYIVKKHKMDSSDIKTALKEGTPIAIRNNLIIGYDNLKKAFETSAGDFIQVERPVDAIAIEDLKPDSRGDFAIVGNNEWESDLNEFFNVIGSLKVGEIYLPKHSAIFNFLKPTNETKKDKIQSMLNGVNIDIFEKENYIDNALHEMGHLFWRTCMKYEEKIQLEELFKNLKPCALYEYEWERSDAEEVFCTLYKWYLKSILLNRSFYNILEYEEPRGLNILQQVFERLARDRAVEDIWDISQDDFTDYFNPKFDKITSNYIRKKGLFDSIKDVKIPEYLLNNIDSVHDGIEFLNFGKAIIPVKDGIVDFENLSKAKDLYKNKLKRK